MGFVAAIGAGIAGVSSVIGGIGQADQLEAQARAELARGILAEEDSKVMAAQVRKRNEHVKSALWTQLRGGELEGGSEMDALVAFAGELEFDAMEIERAGRNARLIGEGASESLRSGASLALAGGALGAVGSAFGAAAQLTRTN